MAELASRVAIPSTAAVRRQAVPGRAAPAEADEILRFQRSERLLHWAIAIPFLTCFATALVLVLFYNPYPLRPFRGVFSWTHRLSGVALIVMPTVVLLAHRRDFKLHVYNIRQAWIWTYDDVKWICLTGAAAVSKKVSLPEQGKFNAGEKLNFMMVMTTYPLFIATGVLIWMPGIAFLSWILHFSMAVVAAPLVLGHLFMATVNPSSRIGLSGMISGFVDRRWAKHHYGLWYAEHFAEEAPSEQPLREPESPPRIPAVIRCASCLREHAVASWNHLLDSLRDLAPLPCPACGSEMDLVSVIAEPFEEVDWILRRLEGAGAPGPAPEWSLSVEEISGWSEPRLFRDEAAPGPSAPIGPPGEPGTAVSLRRGLPVG